MTVQRPAEQSFSQQFVRPQQMLEGKVKTPSPDITRTVLMLSSALLLYSFLSTLFLCLRHGPRAFVSFPVMFFPSV